MPLSYPASLEPSLFTSRVLTTKSIRWCTGGAETWIVNLNEHKTHNSVPTFLKQPSGRVTAPFNYVPYRTEGRSNSKTAVTAKQHKQNGAKKTRSTDDRTARTCLKPASPCPGGVRSSLKRYDLREPQLRPLPTVASGLCGGRRAPARAEDKRVVRMYARMYVCLYVICMYFV